MVVSGQAYAVVVTGVQREEGGTGRGTGREIKGEGERCTGYSSYAGLWGDGNNSMV